MNQFRRLLSAALCVVLLSACNVRVTANILLRPDGSGKIQVKVDLDEEATTLAKRDAGSLQNAVLTSDLQAAGWKVGSWEERDGAASLTLERSTSSPSELQAAIEDLAGGTNGVAKNVNVKIDSGLFQSDAAVDFDLDLKSLKLDDPEALSKLQPFGVDAAAITELADRRATNNLEVKIVTDLPVSDPVTKRFSWGTLGKVHDSSTAYQLKSGLLVTFGGLFVLLGLAGVAGNARKRKRRARASKNRGTI